MFTNRPPCLKGAVERSETGGYWLSRNIIESLRLRFAQPPPFRQGRLFLLSFHPYKPRFVFLQPLCYSLCKLTVVKLGVKSVFTEKFLVRALLVHPTVLHNKYAVGVPNC